ncbi:unnamed protein product [Staurois parvus]|uniref:Uncharacterized protein n=1 Tax=Staurois parvus TaxID=386267 RepID=A0ABN9C7L1_9NEOB|nr:unnamed protein product [Staurois parvus]
MRASGESGYSECGVRGERYSVMRGPGRADIVNAGSGESGYSVMRGLWERGYSECRVREETDIVNAGSGESGI